MKRFNSRLKPLLALVVATTLLTACGGDGGGDVITDFPDGGDGTGGDGTDGDGTGGDGTGGDGTDTNDCGTPIGSAVNDAYNSNNGWMDNCNVSTTSWSKSSYTLGIQRLIWCTGGFGETSTLEEVADADFGPLTKNAVEQFQENNLLEADGVVGSNTWSKLQEMLELSFTSEAGVSAYQTYPQENAAFARCSDGANPNVFFYDYPSGVDIDGLISQWVMNEDVSITPETVLNFDIRHPIYTQ